MLFQIYSVRKIFLKSHVTCFVFLFNGATSKFEVIYVTCITVDATGLAGQGREARSRRQLGDNCLFSAKENVILTLVKIGKEGFIQDDCKGDSNRKRNWAYMEYT